MPIVVHGLKEMRAALRETADASPREIRDALLADAKVITARSNELAPRRSGKLAGNGRPYATTTQAGVRYTLIYAPVQEFADHVWLRHERGAGGAPVSRSAKKHFKRTGDSGGMEPVDYSGLPPTPRFANRAVEELGPGLIQSSFDRLVEVLKAHGWFTG